MTATITTTNNFYGAVALEVLIKHTKDKRKTMNRFVAISFAMLACAVLTSTVKADEGNRKMAVTFSAPVEIPGVHLAGWAVLPAGTYVFKMLDSQSDRHVVQVFSQDEKTIYATILAIPNYRLRGTNKTVMTFREMPAGEPEALRAWFCPGRNWGEEFVYPKAKALVLAKATNTPVLFTEAGIPAEVAEPIMLAEPPVVEQLKQAPVTAFTSAGESVPLAEVVTPPPAEAQAVPAAAGPVQMLPATASHLPLIGLIGLIAIGGAFAARTAARRLS